MYLKSIEMQGFKSFAHKIRLDFHDGITGIVGPNGSGKSNVADAVRWVLGEQSARQLRGGNMQDVIFAGTETRKALGYASVAITLDNADRQAAYDAEEITVTRRLYRSGESEYLLNGRSCRLRDILELFYDTGIGKEGYSIIGQGQIDRILSGKPDDRRELFDEAAGIVKFKRRKTASLKKLAEEQQNMVRVSDILSEITRQLGPLEKQSEKAEQYLRLRDHLRSLEAGLFLLESGRTETQLAELAGKHDTAAAQLSETELAFARTREEYDRIEQELSGLDDGISAARDSLQKEALEKQQEDGAVSVLREQIRAANANSDLYRDRIRSLEDSRLRRQEELEGTRTELTALDGQIREAEAEKTRSEQETADLQAHLEENTAKAEQLRTDTIRLLNDRTSVREKLQRYRTMLEQIGIRRSQLTSRMLEMKQETDSQASAVRDLEEELKQIQKEGEAEAKAMEAAEARIAEQKQVMDRLNRQLEDGQAAFHRESSRLESLKNLTERYEGYGNSIRKVMELRDNNPGIHGVIADLIRTGKKYETAIETALGGNLQNIVTDNESTAKYLIEYLKRGRYGRATFLPLTTMRPDKPLENPELMREAGVLGRADTLVTCDEKYQGIVSRLLGRTVVVDTIDHAIVIGRKYSQSVRMVTLEGELLSPGGSMTGGSFRTSSNLLGRRREIRELEIRVRSLKKETENAQQAIEDAKTVRNRYRDELSERNDALQKLYLRQNTVRINLESARSQAGTLQEEYRRVQGELNEIAAQVSELQAKQDGRGEELRASEAQEKVLEQTVRDLSTENESLRQQVQESAAGANQAAVRWANVRQQAGFLEEKIRTAQEEMTRLDAEKATVLSDMENEEGGIADKEAQIRSLQESIGEREKRIGEMQEQIQALSEKRDALNRDHRAFFEKRDELSGEKNRLEQEIFRLESQKERLQESLDTLTAYLYDQYEMTPDQAERFAPAEPMERAPLRREIAAAKSDIKDLGSVNVNAIEEYKELRERHTFLRSQHDDLVRAAEALQEIISELDESMRRQFLEKFGQIREEFDKVFRQLFGGGKGTLELSGEDDILESGIVITAQPPGKKLQNMMQLSGGEKALTAIALLFAIQRLKPSPFCLLDEIEAALDDSNVTRFAQYLQKLSGITQFIVITHRRGTMTAADRLYGITMQEKGVSSLVSVNLIEAQLDQ